MALERKKITGVSPKDIANINANMEALWYKMFGNLNLGDVDEQFVEKVNTSYTTVQGEGNLDSTHPLYVRFYIPPNIKRINKAPINIMLSRYRMDSAVSNNSGAIVDANINISTERQGVTASASQQSITASAVQQSVAVSVASQNVTASVSPASVGATSSTKAATTIAQPVTNWGGNGSRVIGSPKNKLGSLNMSMTTSGDKYIDAASGGNYMAGSPLVSGMVDLWSINHKHNVTIPSHSHTINIKPHTHSINIQPHTHSVTVQPHTHSIVAQPHTHDIIIEPHSHQANAKITIPAHSHSLIEGIKDATVAPSNVSVYINDNLLVGGLSGDGKTVNDLDIAEYINTGGWNTIKFTSHNVSRVTIYGIIEVVNQSFTKR